MTEVGASNGGLVASAGATITLSAAQLLRSRAFEGRGKYAFGHGWECSATVAKPCCRGGVAGEQRHD